MQTASPRSGGWKRKTVETACARSHDPSPQDRRQGHPQQDRLHLKVAWRLYNHDVTSDIYGHNVTADALFRSALFPGKAKGPPQDEALGSDLGSVEDMLRELMALNGEPRYARVLELLVRRNLVQPTVSELGAANPATSPTVDWDRLRQTLAGAETLGELTRAAAVALSKADTAAKRSDMERDIYAALSRLAPGQWRGAVLTSLNIISKHFLQHGVGVGYKIRALCIRYSFAARSFSSLVQHVRWKSEIDLEEWRFIISTLYKMAAVRHGRRLGAIRSFDDGHLQGWEAQQIECVLRATAEGLGMRLTSDETLDLLQRLFATMAEYRFCALIRQSGSKILSAIGLEYEDLIRQHPERTDALEKTMRAKQKVRAAIVVGALAKAGDRPSALQLALDQRLHERDARGKGPARQRRPVRLEFRLWADLIKSAHPLDRPRIVAHILGDRWPRIIRDTNNIALGRLCILMGVDGSSCHPVASRPS